MEKLMKYVQIVTDNGLEAFTPENKGHILTEIESKLEFRYQLDRLGCIYDLESSDVMGYITMIKLSKVPSRVLKLH